MPLGQQHLGADVPVHGWLLHYGAGGHFVTGWGAAGHHEGLGALATGEPAWRGDSDMLQVSISEGEVPGTMLPAQPHCPLAPVNLGMYQSHMSLPSPEHRGSVRGALFCPKNQISVGFSPDSCNFGTSCGSEKPGAELGTIQILKGGIELTPSLLVSPGPLAGTAAPVFPTIPWSPHANHHHHWSYRAVPCSPCLC